MAGLGTLLFPVASSSCRRLASDESEMAFWQFRTVVLREEFNMDAWFSNLSTLKCLSSEALVSLQTDGFIVVNGPVPKQEVAELAASYDRAVEAAAIEDVKIGSDRRALMEPEPLTVRPDPCEITAEVVIEG